MRLEGTLDAFSLPDIFQLLSYTKKTGALHLRREGAHGVVHVRDGAVTGARSDVRRQALGRRLVGAGLVDDELLAAACEELADSPERGLGSVLVELGAIDGDAVRELAGEQATDAVFDLLRWADGEFAFVVDEGDPDDLGASLAVDEVVREARQRLHGWAALTASVPAPDAVVSVVPSPPSPPTLSGQEWALLALVDGRRTVADLVALSGRGDYAVVGALGGLVERGLVTVRPPGADDDGTSAVVRRQQLLAAVEGLPVEPALAPPAPPATRTPVEAQPPGVPAVPAQERAAVIPDRPEPFTPARRPDHVEETPAYARASAPSSTPPTPHASAGSVGAVHGATAMQPDHSLEVAPLAVERDPSVNKSLLLRLIAGVRGL